MLSRITPVVLTANEEPNIERTLAKLTWAKEVVLVDSVSNDATVAIAQRFPNVRVVQRPFDSHARQWTYAVDETNIATEWVLTLDADYVLTDELIAELDTLEPANAVAYDAHFIYAIFGRPLRGSIYPPRPVLLRRGAFTFEQDGHTQRVRVNGTTAKLSAPIIHDDRKSLDRFLARQQRYMSAEADKLARGGGGMRDRLRRMRIIAPPLVLLHTLFVRGCIRDGWPGICYAFERTIAELILSMTLIARDLGIDDRR
jgi:glycosyltransferase involved in cell wall biosynthesis